MGTLGLCLALQSANGASDARISLPREAISCPLCEEPFATEEPRTPCVLPCFHTFCRQCVSGWAAQGGAAAADADGKAGYSCPTCRAVCETDVGALQVNFALMTVIEAERISTGQTALVCQECDQEEEPSNYCAECGLLLCSKCADYHRTSKRFKGHALQTVEEFKARRQALPRQKRTCKKHKDQALDLYCSTCHLPICFHCTVKEHAGHDYDLLTDVAGKHEAGLCSEADSLLAVKARLDEGIARIRAEEEALVRAAREQTDVVGAHFAELVEALGAREQELKQEIEAARARKQKVLEGQREGLECAAASMASGSEHAHRMARLGDVFEVMQAYSMIVGGMRSLRDKEYQLQPNTSASIAFVDTSGGGTARVLARHARVVAREVCPSACRAEGAGLEIAITKSRSSFMVRAVGFEGQECTEGGDDVQVRLVSAGEGGQEAADLCADVQVEDRGDGSYACTYAVAEGTEEQVVRLEVRVNGGHVCGSPFAVSIKTEVELTFRAPFDGNGALHFIATGGGKRAYANPHDAGLVVASMSSVANGDPVYGHPRRFVQADLDGNHNFTNDARDSWMAVDLLQRQLKPTYYCLRSEAIWNFGLRCKMRNWRLEGSNDGSTWTTLREHRGDAHLGDEVFSVAAWPVEERAGFFRHFRIFQTGNTSVGNFQLMCAGIELYGTLRGQG